MDFPELRRGGASTGTKPNLSNSYPSTKKKFLEQFCELRGAQLSL
jgi:hypothetical protein